MNSLYGTGAIIDRGCLFSLRVALTSVCFFLLSFVLPAISFGQELEFAPTSFTGTPQGPSTTAPQALTLLQNTTGTTFVPYSPPVSVSASLSNQQFTNLAGGGTGTGLSFGTNINNSAKSAGADGIYVRMNAIGGGTNAQFTSNPNGTAGTGIDVTTNTAFNVFASTEALNSTILSLLGLGFSTSGRYYYGNITLTFSRPVNDPVVHFVGLGGTSGSGLGFSTNFELATTGVTLSRLSGSPEFTITSSGTSYSINNAASVLSATCGSGGACGSVRVTGTNITSLTFRIYVRGDGNGTAFNNTNTYSGDKFLVGVSLRSPSTLSGTIFDDANGLTDNLINGTGTNTSPPLYANLVSSNTVLTVATIPTSGTYAFSGLWEGNYSVVLSTTAGTVGSTPPAASLPSNWVNTGEGIGTTSPGDGTPNGVVSVAVSGTGTTNDVPNINFGINQRPSSASATITLASQANPGGTSTAPIAITAFAGSDPEDGPYAAGLTGRRVALGSATNGTLYYNGSPVSTSALITNFNPALVALDPIDGAVTASFTYLIYDNALVSAPSATTVNVPFNLLSISGTIVNDANGLTDNIISGTATNAGGPLYVVVSNAASGTVVTSTLVPATGVYSVTGLYPASYSVRLSTTSVAVGATAPAVSLPANYTSIGEGTAVTGDGTPNGITSVTLTTTNVTGVNFGLDQLPSPTSVTLTAQANPGGTNSILVPSTIPTGTDTDGLVSRILYTAFPANATSISIDGTIYTATTFPSGGVTAAVGTTLLVDPIDGVVTVSVPFRVIDNALQVSLATGTVTIPFTCPILLCPVIIGQKTNRI